MENDYAFRDCCRTFGYSDCVIFGCRRGYRRNEPANGSMKDAKDAAVQTANQTASSAGGQRCLSNDEKSASMLSVRHAVTNSMVSL